MIHIKIEEKDFPEDLLKKAKEAADKVQSADPENRKEVLAAVGPLWTEFKAHLAPKSHGKCWYSEARDDAALMDVDHFRPKSEAIREGKVKDDGYPWLAFDWKNFRLAAQRCNRVTTNEETGEVFGKGSHFPLLPGSPVANWDDRCEINEKPLLLDPTSEIDVLLIAVDDDGDIVPASHCKEDEQARVKTSARLLGLNLPTIRDGRRSAMANVTEVFERMKERMEDRNNIPDPEARRTITDLLIQAQAMCTSDKPYSRATSRVFDQKKQFYMK